MYAIESNMETIMEESYLTCREEEKLIIKCGYPHTVYQVLGILQQLILRKLLHMGGGNGFASDILAHLHRKENGPT